MSIALHEEVKALREKVNHQADINARLFQEMAELTERIQLIEERKKPGPKPKA